MELALLILVIFGLIALWGAISPKAQDTPTPPKPSANPARAAQTKTQTGGKVPAFPPGQPVKLRGGGRYDVVGESHYQPALEAVAGERDEDGVEHVHHRVILRTQPNNPHDRNAVGIFINDRLTGHIPRDETHKFLPLLRAVEKTGGYVWADGQLSGGWKRDTGKRREGLIGVVLDVKLPVRVAVD